MALNSCTMEIFSFRASELRQDKRKVRLFSYFPTHHFYVLYRQCIVKRRRAPCLGGTRFDVCHTSSVNVLMYLRRLGRMQLNNLEPRNDLHACSNAV